MQCILMPSVVSHAKKCLFTHLRNSSPKFQFCLDLRSVDLANTELLVIDLQPLPIPAGGKLHGEICRRGIRFLFRQSCHK